MLSVNKKISNTDGAEGQEKQKGFAGSGKNKFEWSFFGKKKDAMTNVSGQKDQIKNLTIGLLMEKGSEAKYAPEDIITVLNSIETLELISKDGITAAILDGKFCSLTRADIIARVVELMVFSKEIDKYHVHSFVNFVGPVGDGWKDDKSLNILVMDGLHYGNDDRTSWLYDTKSFSYDDRNLLEKIMENARNVKKNNQKTGEKLQATILEMLKGRPIIQKYVETAFKIPYGRDLSTVPAQGGKFFSDCEVQQKEVKQYLADLKNKGILEIDPETEQYANVHPPKYPFKRSF